MACGDFKDLALGTASDKILCDKAFNIAKNPKYNGNVELLQWSIIVLIKMLLVLALKMSLFQTSFLWT